MKTTSEQRAELQRRWDMLAADWTDEDGRSSDEAFQGAFFAAWPALLADAERAEVLERALRDLLSASGVVALSDAITRAKAALGETT